MGTQLWNLITFPVVIGGIAWRRYRPYWLSNCRMKDVDIQVDIAAIVRLMQAPLW
jgi:hypothetical protein